mmetsp:Transcript_119937/g.384034  ORF Transcript_119937/g.384034 Transcript_119937/m.384034 type:complete len:278 (-) Transcript_119937:675-1508(-)
MAPPLSWLAAAAAAAAVAEARRPDPGEHPTKAGRRSAGCASRPNARQSPPARPGRAPTEPSPTFRRARVASSHCPSERTMRPTLTCQPTLQHSLPPARAAERLAEARSGRGRHTRAGTAKASTHRRPAGPRPAAARGRRRPAADVPPAPRLCSVPLLPSPWRRGRASRDPSATVRAAARRPERSPSQVHKPDLLALRLIPATSAARNSSHLVPVPTFECTARCSRRLSAPSPCPAPLRVPRLARTIPAQRSRLQTADLQAHLGGEQEEWHRQCPRNR